MRAHANDVEEVRVENERFNFNTLRARVHFASEDAMTVHTNALIRLPALLEMR